MEDKIEDENKLVYKDYSNNTVEDIKEDTENMILNNQNLLSLYK